MNNNMQDIQGGNDNEMLVIELKDYHNLEYRENKCLFEELLEEL